MIIFFVPAVEIKDETMLENSLSLTRADLLVNFDETSLNWLGLNWDSPSLVVSDVLKAIQFYECVFGFVPIFILPNEFKEITFARMRYRGTYFTLTAKDEDLEADFMFGPDNPVSSLYLYVDDVEKVLATAAHYDARILETPHIDLFGDHKARMMDIFGYIWDIAARL